MHEKTVATTGIMRSILRDTTRRARLVLKYQNKFT